MVTSGKLENQKIRKWNSRKKRKRYLEEVGSKRGEYHKVNLRLQRASGRQESLSSLHSHAERKKKDASLLVKTLIKSIRKSKVVFQIE